MLLISYQIEEDGSFNTAIGNNSLMSSFMTSYTSAFGYNSGSQDISGTYNTYLGAYSDISMDDPLHYSTALGYGATIDDSHQVVLGDIRLNMVDG